MSGLFIVIAALAFVLMLPMPYIVLTTQDRRTCRSASAAGLILLAVTYTFTYLALASS